MDAKVLYWTFAFANMGVIVALALRAMGVVKAGNPELHRRLMLGAAALVVGFVVSYAFKLYFLGREDLSFWSARDINILRFHESCVLVMLVGGGLAILWGGHLRKTRLFTRNPEDPRPDPTTLKRHRLAGRFGLVGALLGFVSAGFVLAGMFARLNP
ncbi:MAG: DUF420 domain-containing protein [Myxococcota bacterium]|jgi:uncharacterized membrane protein YozB (DUF420 family)|nr:DUF420 domain-containing protein [Myxococcota bacterium]